MQLVVHIVGTGGVKLVHCSERLSIAHVILKEKGESCASVNHSSLEPLAKLQAFRGSQDSKLEQTQPSSLTGIFNIAS